MTATDASAALAAIRAREQAATRGPWTRGTYTPAAIWAGFRAVATLSIPNDNFRADAEFIAHARTDVPRMAAALDAVLALHTRTGGYSNGAEFDCCGTCFDQDEQPEPWPCPTLAAITDALGGGAP